MRQRPAGPILVVEDNEETRYVLRRVLDISGYQVVTTENGAEALAYLRAGQPVPCLIIVDVFMPVMNGRAFAQEVCADPILSRIPIIAYSAGAEDGTIPGATAFFRKSMDPDILLALIERHCHRE